MKNEEAVLLRLLNSIYHILDWWTVVDTGSSDSSREIVTQFFKEKGIPGELIDFEFTNFEEVRNIALNKSREHCDWIFWIDCDEELILPEFFDINKFKEYLNQYDSINTKVEYSTISYSRKNFFRSNLNIEWKGKVHEVLISDDYILTGEDDSIITLVRSDGYSWKEGETKKYLDHAKILLKEVYRTKEPRDVFYLAQSYRDAGDINNAIKWYKVRRDQLDGFWEERYYSQFMIGTLMMNRLDYSQDQAICELLKCEEYDNSRAEHLHNIIVYYHHRKLWNLAKLIGDIAISRISSGFPNRLLFLNNSTYTGAIESLHSITLDNLK